MQKVNVVQLMLLRFMGNSHSFTVFDVVFELSQFGLLISEKTVGEWLNLSFDSFAEQLDQKYVTTNIGIVRDGKRLRVKLFHHFQIAPESYRPDQDFGYMEVNSSILRPSVALVIEQLTTSILPRSRLQRNNIVIARKQRETCQAALTALYQRGLLIIGQHIPESEYCEH